MDVKQAARGILPISLGKVSEAKLREATTSEAHTTTDRDANGQQQREQPAPRRNLSEEELQEAIKILEALPGVKDNGLKFKLSRSEDGVPVVHVEDRNGKIVRRIPETELSLLKARTSEQKSTGNLLNKAM